MKFLALFLFSLGFVCHASKENRPEKCYLAPDAGPCRALFESYYFNNTTGKCERFFYGGCEGNGNNFEDEAECKKVCRAS